MRVRWMLAVAVVLGFAACNGGALDHGGGDAGPGDASPVGTGATGAPFAFVVNGVAQSPMTCPSANWEFAPYPKLPQGQDSGCSWDTNHPGCGGVTSVHISNTGTVPLVYLARPLWSGGYVPGVTTGDGPELAGVIDPGADVDITKVFDGGMVAILGSSKPFSSADKFVYDEGTIPWPAGVQGSGGATTMHVAQLEVYDSCIKPSKQWL